MPQLRFLSPHDVVQHDLAEELDAEFIGKSRGHMWEQVTLPFWLNKRGGGLLINLANTAPVFYRNKIVTIHDVAFFVNPRWYSRSFYAYYRIVIPKVARGSGRVVTVSQFAKTEIIRLLGIDEGTISVVGNAVSAHVSAAPETPPGGYGDYILALSPGSYRKNFQRVMQAFLKQQHMSVNLLVVGSANKHLGDNALSSKPAYNPRVVFTGHVDDKELSGLYRNALFLAYPSLYEGFGIPPLEAMSCGCPCLVSDSSSLPEVCGAAALYCDPFSVDDIAAKMKLLLDDESLRKKLIALGHEQVKKFDWDRSAEAFARLIEEEWRKSNSPLSP